MWASIAGIFGFNQYSNYGTANRLDPHFVFRLKETQSRHLISGVFCGDHPVNVVEVQLNGQTFQAIISSKTTISFCSQKVVQALNLREFKVDGLKIGGIFGPVKFSGYCKATLEIEDLFVDNELLVFDGKEMLADLMIGADLLKRLEQKYGYLFGYDGAHYTFGPVDLTILKKNGKL